MALRWKRLGDLVPAVLAGWKEQLDSPIHSVCELWQAVVGTEVAAHASPVTLRNGVLTVSVDSAAWGAELARFRRDEILEGLNNALGATRITSVRFTISHASPSIDPGDQKHA